MHALVIPDANLAHTGEPPALAAPLPEKMDGEPTRWFTRFCGFLNLGPARSVDGAYRAEQPGAKR